MATHWAFEGAATSGIGTRWRRLPYAQDGYGNRHDSPASQDPGANFTMADVLIAPPGILPNNRTEMVILDYLQIIEGSAGPAGPAGATGPTGPSGAGAGASVGLASARPTATGSGRMFFASDIGVCYVDDPTAVAWVQYVITPAPAPPSLASYTLVGKLGAAQYADCIRASVYDQSANIASCALAAGSLGSSSTWVVTLAASFLAPATSYPGLGLCVANGTTSGTSDLWAVGVYVNGSSSLTMRAQEAIVGGAIVGSTLSDLTVVPAAQIGNGNCMHFRLLADGVNLHFQYGDGVSFFDLYTMATPSGLTDYGFVIGQGPSTNARCMATVFSNTLGALTIPQSTVSNVAAGTPGVVTTSAAHGLVSGDWVAIHGVGGSSGANTGTGTNWASGAASVHVTSATTFELTGLTVTGTYTSGGVVTLISR